ncbi:MAG TPA: hypothetical protein VK576_02805 [Thermoleophilia bacterium]|nr:hypothetical protein [Thermoleophilia bacterium]
MNEPPQPGSPQPGQQPPSAAPPPWALEPPAAPTPAPSPPPPGQQPPPHQGYPPQPPGQSAPSSYPPPGPPPPYQGYPPPPGQPPPYQGYPPPPPGYAGYPPYGQPDELRRVKNQRTVLLVILAVIGLIVLSTFAACAQACVGCGRTIHTIQANSWTIKRWGWQDGSGPHDLTSESAWANGGLESRDKLPYDPAKDAQLKDGLRAIHDGLERYQNDHQGKNPDAFGDLSGVLSGYVSPWPTNPWTGEPMREGEHRGDYQYQAYGNDQPELWVNLSASR